MNPVTVRRLLVFGVCAVGVTSLYLLPGATRAPSQVGAPRPDDERTSWPVGSGPTVVAATTASTTSPARTRDAVPPDPTSTREPGHDPSSARAPEPAAPPTRHTGPTRSGATASDPAGDADVVAPAPVPAISTAAVTADRLTLHWPPASDNVGVTAYKVMLNGFEVATTTRTHATVRWFNDDLGAHVVQVLAVDAAGNESTSSPNLLVDRPTPGPTPSPTGSTPAAPPSPTPSSTPAPSASGSAEVPVPHIATSPSATAPPSASQPGAESASAADRSPVPPAPTDRG